MSFIADEPLLQVLDHKVVVEPGHCMLHKDPDKNYGVAACRIWFYAIGPKGAVQFRIGTDWYPEAARRHLSKFPHREERQPQGWDIGYHSRVPIYDGQTSMGLCDIIGCECYYDRSSLQADNWIEGFICGGTEWLWPKLDELYRCQFEGGEYPDLTPQPRKNPKTGE
jgi:hypothetical protein